MNAAAPRSTVEGSDVVPDNSVHQVRRFHPGHEGCRCASFPFDVTDSAKPGEDEVQAELEAAGAGAQGESSQLRGTCSHATANSRGAEQDGRACVCL